MATPAETRDVQWLAGFFAAHRFASTRPVSQIRHSANGLPIEGDLSIGNDAQATVIDGDLVVTGNLFLGDSGGVWVTGRVRCENLVLGAMDAQFRGGLVASSSVSLRAPHDGQIIEPIHTPLLIRRGAKAFTLVSSTTIVRDAVLSVGATQTLFSVLKARKEAVLTALRSGQTFEAMLSLKKTVSGLVSPRIASLLDAVRSGALYEWARFENSDALRVTRSDGSKQLAILSPAEATVLRAKLSATAAPE